MNTNDVTNSNNSEKESQADQGKPQDLLNKNVAEMSTASKIDYVTYDIRALSQFINRVFHRLSSDEYIITNNQTKGYPMSVESLMHRLQGHRGDAQLGVPLYYSIATVAPTAGVLRNLKSAFKRLHVVVLDDIGTKIPASKIPLEPSYIIESSAGNFQYGYILEYPLENIEIAEVLIARLGDLGYTDEGGCTVNKYVRLPQGIHGKPHSVDINFRSRLVSMSSNNYTLDALCEGFALGFTAEELLSDPTEYFTPKQQFSRIFSTTRPNHTTLEGISDPVLEILYDNNCVYTDNGDYVMIECPWHADHSHGKREAYYSPLGRGEHPDHKARRKFICFHDHCKKAERNTSEFLAYMSATYEEEFPVFDPCADLIPRYFYDTKNDCIWNLDGDVPEALETTNAFKRTHYKTYSIPSIKNARREIRWKYASTYDLFIYHPQRVSVFGAVFDPAQRKRIISDGGHQRLNLYTPPQFNYVKPDMALLEPFFDNLNYLIPDPEERHLLLSMLAAKLRDMSFRGWGVVMIAPEQRTGRGTLMEVLSHVFCDRHTLSVKFKELIGDGRFNEYLANPILFVPEMEKVAEDGRMRHTVYNDLKMLVDTTGKQITIDHKYGKRVKTKTCTMFIFMSNNSVASLVPHDDQRLFIIRNPSVPRNSAYYAKYRREFVTARVDGVAPWRDHLCSYLWDYQHDLSVLNGSAPQTPLKARMQDEGVSTIDLAFETMLDLLPHALIPSHVAQDIFSDPRVVEALELRNQRGKLNDFIRHRFNHYTLACARTFRPTLNVKRTRCRINPAKTFSGLIHPSQSYYEALETNEPSPQQKKLRQEIVDDARPFWEDFNARELIDKLLTSLHNEGRIDKFVGLNVESTIASIKKVEFKNE